MAAGPNKIALPRPEDVALSYAAPIPVVVLTGFLGSGKTSLVRRLIAMPEFANTAVVINEFGEIAIDHMLVEAAQDDIVVLEGGCLCCASHGDLARALRTLLERRERRELPAFERVVVETSGLADPTPILQSFLVDPLRLSQYRLRKLVTVLDGICALSTLERHAVARRQAALADFVLVTKLDAIPSSARSETLARLSEATDRPVRAADIRLADLFTSDTAVDFNAPPSDHTSHLDHDCVAITRRRVAPVSSAAIGAWLAEITRKYGDHILRLKGVIPTAEGDWVAIHAVQHLWYRPEVLTGPHAPEVGSLVMIVASADRALAEDAMSWL